MDLLYFPLQGAEWYLQIKEQLKKNQVSLTLNGCVDSEKLHVIAACNTSFRVGLIVTYSEMKAREIYEEYRFYDKNVYLYPAKDLIFYQADINGRQLEIDRMKVYRAILSGEKLTIVTTFDALMEPVLPREILQENIITLEKGSIVSEQAIALKLIAMGYEKTYQVEAPGQFSIRGGIVDIYDLTQENPYRIELWGDEVDSIRSFDVLSQRSIETLEEVSVYSATEMILSKARKEEGYQRIRTDARKLMEQYKKEFKAEEAHRIELLFKDLEHQLLEMDQTTNLEGYIHYFYPETITFLQLFLPEELCAYVDEPARVKEHAAAVELEFRESMMHRLEKGYILPGQTGLIRSAEATTAELSGRRSLSLQGLAQQNALFDCDGQFSVNTRSLPAYHGSFQALVENLKKLKQEGYRIVLLSASRTRANRLAGDITEAGVVASYTENEDKRLQPGEIVTFYGRIKKGFEYPGLKFIVFTETDIFGQEKKKKKRPKYTGGTKIRSFDELQVGDYVIHEDCGIAIYRGIENIEVAHVRKDYMKLEYRDGGILYVLATALDMIQFYAGKDAKPPKLNKLGTQEWNKTKTKTRMAVGEVAKELVSLYYKRQQKTGYCYSKDTVWQKEFEEMFPYEETEDQLNAIMAAKGDMESTKIMDRLICGDVGFGKTEIAIRTAFKAVQEGKQVAYLVPTTILAQQHFNTFTERMKDFPVRVDMMSRFCTASEIKKTLSDLKKGLVDIVIGTHRLLSKDVEFHDLGLLVIDEEQRFGVAHKEKIKQMKENLDVLTLTATPIPRTLHMSMIGVRDMSVLEEAPQDRLPIQTYVMEYNEEMVREAIVRELARDGQVYYVFNRVGGIAEMTGKIAGLVPEARVAYAHGQMKETELENIMMDFINHEIDVLVSTTIIETGLDIPNVNTMIIHDADTFGLAQLYQLRGRVGRSNRNSYAFLMYHKGKLLEEVAEKRLTAIKEFTELGSGYKIAMRDLEIRGAGTLLGKMQHGHMQAVGYDLYCKMLEEAVREEQGLEKKENTSVAIDLDVDAYIPEEYIVNEVQKLDIYKRIASVQSRADCDEMRDELRDRFGTVPERAENLLRIALLKVMAGELHVSEVRGIPGRIRVVMRQNAPVAVEEIPVFLNEYAGDLRLKPQGLPEFILKYDIEGLVEKDERLLLDQTEKLLLKMQMLYPEKKFS